MSAISVWSAEDSDSRPTSSKPVALRPASTISPMVVMLRSRTGRVIMPAWQKRHPRVQPRKISTDMRSWTVSASGTSGGFGEGHAASVGQVGDVVEARDVHAAGSREAQQHLVASARTSLGLPGLHDLGDDA